MTYANDCIEIRDQQKRKTLRRIEQHTTAELNAAVERARRKFGDDFWLLLHGIDAYMERRKRRRSRRQRIRDELIHRAAMEDFMDPWGNS